MRPRAALRPLASDVDVPRQCHVELGRLEIELHLLGVLLLDLDLGRVAVLQDTWQVVC